MYELIVSILGTPPAEYEWLYYVLSGFILCYLISAVCALIVRVLRAPFRG